MRPMRLFPAIAVNSLAFTLMLVGCAAPGAPSVARQPSPTLAASPTATSSPHRDWRTYQDAQFGFQIDVPAALAGSGGPVEANATEVGFAYNFDLGTPPPDQVLFAQLKVDISATTANYLPVCDSLGKGTPITIGSGLTAYQQDNLTATPVPNASNAPWVRVSLVTGGVGIVIVLSGHDPPDTFFARYGAIWQHMLASFVPGPSVPTGHPCG